MNIDLKCYEEFGSQCLLIPSVEIDIFGNIKRYPKRKRKKRKVSSFLGLELEAAVNKRKDKTPNKHKHKHKHEHEHKKKINSYVSRKNGFFFEKNKVISFDSDSGDEFCGCDICMMLNDDTF